MGLCVPNTGFSEVALDTAEVPNNEPGSFVLETNSGALLDIVSVLDPNKDGAVELAKIEPVVAVVTEIELVVTVPKIEVPTEVVELGNDEVVVMREPVATIVLGVLTPEELIADIVVYAIELVGGATVATSDLGREELPLEEVFWSGIECVATGEVTVILLDPFVIAKLVNSNVVLGVSCEENIDAVVTGEVKVTDLATGSLIVVEPNEIVGLFIVVLWVLIFVSVPVFVAEKPAAVLVTKAEVTEEAPVEIVIGFSNLERPLPNKMSFDLAGVTNILLDVTSLLILVFIKENDGEIDLLENASLEIEEIGLLISKLVLDANEK